MTETAIPEGFKLRHYGDGFIAANGPLYLKKLERGIALGFRVERRHCNPMGMCHGGMIATFCDMLLPISAHYLSQDLGRRFLPTISLQIDGEAVARVSGVFKIGPRFEDAAMPPASA
jgi:acyl-coenzyme A thioesterase PaaI-like protein